MSHLAHISAHIALGRKDLKGCLVDQSVGQLKVFFSMHDGLTSLSTYELAVNLHLQILVAFASKYFQILGQQTMRTT